MTDRPAHTLSRVVPEADLKDLGARIRALREAVDLRQQDLADATGLSRTSVTNIEAGRQDTGATTLLAIAAALRVPVGDLFGAPDSGRLPSLLASRVTGSQRRITSMLVEMADLMGKLAEESEKRHVELAALVGQPADPDLASKAVTDPRQLATGLDLTDEERQAFLDALESRREGGTYADGWRAAVAALRDDERYRHWWTARDYPPHDRYWESVPRNHLADYLRTVGPDGPEVTRG